MARIRRIIVSFSNDGQPGPMIPATVVMGRFWVGARARWRVCWAGDTEDYGFCAHYGPPVLKEEAERRMEWGMKEYPHLIYWLEKAV